MSPLFEKYPTLLGEHTFDLSVGKGWVSIVDDLLQKIIDLGYPSDSLKIVQVKEKFGGLRVYVQYEETAPEGAYKCVEALIGEAAALCRNTCDACGEPGTKTYEGWIRVRCEKHKG